MGLLAFMVSLGVVVCVYEESMRGSLLGLSLVGASAFVQSAQMSVSSRIMTGSSTLPDDPLHGRHLLPRAAAA